MKQFFVLLVLVTAVDFSLQDSPKDTKKEILTIHYSDHTEKQIVFDKKLLDTPEMYDLIDRAMEK
jgi:hypothetical protein